MAKNFKKQFPLFSYHPNLVYLDSAATSQKPKQVIEAIKNYYERQNANIHRGIYQLAEISTAEYEKSRLKVAQFINADPEEIVFTKNSTESINLIAKTWGKTHLKKGDEVLITQMEHHSNLVPWQEITKEIGSRLKYIPVDPKNGKLKMEKIKQLISAKTKILSLTHASNILGTVNDLGAIVKIFRQSGKGIVVGDLAQSITHLPIDVKKLDLDFAVFSSHKLYGPLGVGVLFGRRKILSSLPPFQTGGGNIESVSQYSSTFQPTPTRFEPGTPNIAGVLGLSKAIDFIEHIGWSKIISQEQELTEYALKQLTSLPEVIVYGPKDIKDRIGVIAFNLQGIHAHDVAQILADDNVAIRAGHHCTMPLHQSILKVDASCRVSLAIYNTKDDIDQLIKSLKKAIKIFKKSEKRL